MSKREIDKMILIVLLNDDKSYLVDIKYEHLYFFR